MDASSSLERFRAHPSPRSAINAYLAQIHAEASQRGYTFDKSKFGPIRDATPISTTTGQLAYEWTHLMKKLSRRDPTRRQRFRELRNPEHHPLFSAVIGAVEPWEKVDFG